MLRRFSINFAIFSMALDILVVVFGLWSATRLRPLLTGFSFLKPIPDTIDTPGILYLVFPLVWIGIFASFAVYDGRKYLRIVDEFSILTGASLIAGVSMAGILYFSFRQISRALILLFVLIAYSLFLVWRGIARMGFRVRKEWPDAPRNILIVGAGPLGVRVFEQIEGAEISNLVCAGFLEDDRKLIGKAPTRVLGRIDEIRELTVGLDITDVIIALPHSVYRRMSEVVALTTNLPVKVWVALGFFDLALYKTDIQDFAGIPMLDLRAPALSEYQLLVKRGFDLLIGSLALLLSLPLILSVAVLIWVLDGWPVLFIQKRVGENGRLFDMYKFRTMVRNAEGMLDLVPKSHQEGVPVHKTRDDPRVTRTGRILRRLSLDELPQLFNVINGTMSLVGPRPELIQLVETYKPWQRKRFAVPPGITGWWQVTGRSDKAMHLHTEDDLFYIQNYSIWLDLLILVRTAWIVLLGKGAY